MGRWKKEVIEYRMKVHLFGAGSSPGGANFGLKKARDDGEAEYGACLGSDMVCGK